MQESNIYETILHYVSKKPVLPYHYKSFSDRVSGKRVCQILEPRGSVAETAALKWSKLSDYQDVGNVINLFSPRPKKKNVKKPQELKFEIVGRLRTQRANQQKKPVDQLYISSN